MASKQEKVVLVKVSAYGWDMTKNLARDVLSQGDRLVVYNDLLSQAMRGRVPQIVTPILAARPDANDDVQFVIGGMGRLTSVQHWTEQTPNERLHAALALFRSSKEAPFRNTFIATDQQERISLDTLKGFAEFTDDAQAKVEDVQRAFQSDVLLPVIWSDKSLEDGTYHAIRDLVARQGATISDMLGIYAEEIVKPYVTKSQIAALLNVSAPRVSQLARYHTAMVHEDGLTQVVQRTIRLHNGRLIKKEKGAEPLQFDKLLKLLKIGLRGGNHKTKDGDVLLDFSQDAQERIFQDAFERSWNALEREGPAPSLVKASDKELTLIRYSDLVAAVTEEKSRAVQVVKAVEGEGATQPEESATGQPDSEGASETGEGAEPSADGEGATVPTTDAPRIEASVPTYDDMVNLFDPRRFDGAAFRPIASPIHRYLIGTLSAQACVDILSEVKPDRKRKSVTGLPTVIGVPVPAMSDDTETEGD